MGDHWLEVAVAPPGGRPTLPDTSGRSKLVSAAGAGCHA
ncbi:hypothetical protein ABIE48_000884 [Paenibacillus sp. OAE614]